MNFTSQDASKVRTRRKQPDEKILRDSERWRDWVTIQFREGDLP